MSDDLVKRLRELRSNQYADPNTAPEFVFLDPDLPPSGWEKQYSMDVVYVRGDVMWLNLKEQADRIEELEAKLAEAVEALERIGKGEFAGRSLMSFPPQDAVAHYARVKLGLIKRTKGETE